MNPREKRLLIAVGAVVGLFVVLLVGRTMFMKPLKAQDKTAAGLRDKLAKIKTEQRAFFAAEDVVKGFAQRTFSDDIDQASARSGEMLTKLILQSGLREADFTRLPVGPRRLLRSVSEIGWNVQGQGKLEDVIDLIFLLQNSPYLHRVENLVWSAGEGPGIVKVGLRYLTLVIHPAPEVTPIPLEPKYTLESPERHSLNGIVARDLLRPYIKRAPDKAGPVPEIAAASGPAALRVVSLSEWMGAPEVHVRDLNSQKTLRYKIGDPLADGTIAMVDYRPLPMPGKDGMKSFSRVILKIGNEFWAVERGQTLAEKRRLDPQELPQALSKL